MNQHDDQFDAPTPVLAVNEPAGRQTIEAWGERKGLLPAVLRTASGDRPNPDNWKFEQAKACKHWVDAQLVTEAEFDAGLAEALGLSFR